MKSKEFGLLVMLSLLVAGTVISGGCIRGGENNTSPSQNQTPQSQTPSPLHPREWKSDGIIGENEYTHELSLAGGKLVIHWRNDDEYLFMALKGQTSGWLAIGFEPSTAMKDADMIFGWVEGGEVKVIDAYSAGRYGPHPPDAQLGGTDDILEKSGKEGNGYTVVEFKRKLDTGDNYDKTLAPGKEVNFIFAMADTDDFDTKHNIARGSGKLNLEK